MSDSMPPNRSAGPRPPVPPASEATQIISARPQPAVSADETQIVMPQQRRPQPTAQPQQRRPASPPPPPPLQRMPPPPPLPTPPRQYLGANAERIPQRGPGQPSLKELVTRAHKEGFSDVHLGVGEVPRYRDRGEMVITEYPVTDQDTFYAWLHEVLKPQEIQRFKDTLDFDGATQYEFARVRINIFDSLNGPSLVLRLIPLKILTMEQLRLPPIFKNISDAEKGLVLVTGPTGSGKSTTMAAMVDYINKTHPKNIITIEDPIEFVHQSRKSLIKHREVGMHTLKFDNALKAALREDPDIILVGEMRDKETVNTALKAAQTGHLVMGTLHTNSAIKTIERILNLYSADEQNAMKVAIAESLVSVIAQGLCRTTDGKRAAYHDILVNTETMKDYIVSGQYDKMLELMQNGEFDGMVTMNQSLFNLYQEGRITEEIALEKSPTPNEMAMMLRGRI
ncbi:type IV pilus twitching motility protein PilT [Picosynechococcus sp. PCC 73109]|uniref:type IV pilus twitching motility protein PilT n=3 Tax=Cyanophyceae TaxID=3028117 RepID=UPI00074581DB|nr:type IV pilus twitching motility protein PilT [Picosynechococcus sp. PCC 73109]AMA08939.1 type IV pili twitching motility protein PilT [Picosynechococcus sp. PCC 73109]